MIAATSSTSTEHGVLLDYKTRRSFHVTPLFNSFTGYLLQFGLQQKSSRLPLRPPRLSSCLSALLADALRPSDATSLAAPRLSLILYGFCSAGPTMCNYVQIFILAGALACTNVTRGPISAMFCSNRWATHFDGFATNFA